MLVLSRKEGERLVIDENIVVTVLHVAGGGVRLGIEAPRDVPVHREEILIRDAATTERRTHQVHRKSVASV